MECQICFINESQSHCEFCQLAICFFCVETWLESHSSCLGCKNVWSRMSLSKKVSDFFLKETFKKIMKKHLFEKEKLRFSETQAKMTIENKKKERKKEIEKKISEERKREVKRAFPFVEFLNDEIIKFEKKFEDDLKRYEANDVLLPEQLRFHEKRKKDGLAKINFQIKEIGNRIEDGLKKMEIELKLKYDEEFDLLSKKQILNHKCQNENCLGFLDEENSCSICGEKTCFNCHEVEKKDHECEAGRKETISMIKSDSKPCPNCGMRIERSIGCDHMWCIDCKTPFDWISGKILNRNIAFQNPHFQQEFRRKTISECVSIDEGIGELISNEFNIPKIFFEKLFEFRETILPTFRIVNFTNNEDLRRQFLSKEIKEEEFKEKLEKENRKRELNIELHMILESFDVVIEDSLIFLLATKREQIFLENMAFIQKHFNEILKETFYVFELQLEIELPSL